MTLRARPLIHAADPYQSFDASAHQPDLDGWGSKHEIFGRVLQRVDARDILEIGSWKGASAIHMAQIQQRLGRRGSEIVCVDTWLGSLEFWTNHADPSRYGALNLCLGYPTVYYTFLRNVQAMGFAPVITPFPVTSAIAARFFQVNELTFDVIYVDGSHDYDDVSADLAAYWPLVRPSGVMFGDDYSPHWPDVIAAVDDFAGSRLEVFDERWVLTKD
jgi:SAM-dependent methyltransferase